MSVSPLPQKKVVVNGREIIIQPRRVHRSLLSVIHQRSNYVTYNQAIMTFDRMDVLDKEIKERQDELLACNDILSRMVIKGVNREDN